MSISQFRSFQDTPILHFTLRVVNGLPLLLDEAVPEILRKAWLYSALRDRWFVGVYSIQPDRVSLFASPAGAAIAHRGWLTAWQEITAREINEATHGGGRIWAGCPPPASVASEDDYVRLRALMAVGASATAATGVCTFARCEGVIWQLLPSGEPALQKPASLGLT